MVKIHCKRSNEREDNELPLFCLVFTAFLSIPVSKERYQIPSFSVRRTELYRRSKGEHPKRWIFIELKTAFGEDQQWTNMDLENSFDIERKSKCLVLK